MTREWTDKTLRELALGYMPSGVLLAAAELGVFGVLARGPLSAPGLAATLGTDLRATVVLADALAALGLVVKQDGLYSPAPGTLDTLASDGSATLLPFMQHHANASRAWARLADVVLCGQPAVVAPSLRGSDADHVAYVELMDVIGRRAPEVVAALGSISFKHLLDVGCGPGTWTVAFLRAEPGARATVYDLPDVLPITRRHIEAAGLTDRVRFVSGDYRSDENFPASADLVWISNVAHLNSRRQNRELFAKAHAALPSGGVVMVQEVPINETHAEPLFGAMFAVLMLVRTQNGGTYSVEELCDDLEAAGFDYPELVAHPHERGSIIGARRQD
jgi:SAM-dependent methyltransferase